jgi:hypothetical protein
MTRDGANLNTLMRLSKRSKLSMIVFKDTSGSVFGALVRREFFPFSSRW